MGITAQELARLLPPQSLFAGAPPEELADLLARGHVQTARAGETVLEQGDDGEAVILVLEGVLRISMLTANGREIILDYAEAGALLGEIALLDDKPRTASATAQWASKVLRIGGKAFEAHLARYPRAALALLRDLACRLRQANLTIESDRAFATGPRLARHLKRLTDDKANGHRLASGLSQSELGAFVGVSRENINRQLSVWAGAGVIELAQGRIRILDGEYLSQIAEAAE